MDWYLVSILFGDMRFFAEDDDVTSSMRCSDDDDDDDEGFGRLWEGGGCLSVRGV